MDLLLTARKDNAIAIAITPIGISDDTIMYRVAQEAFTAGIKQGIGDNTANHRRRFFSKIQLGRRTGCYCVYHL